MSDPKPYKCPFCGTEPAIEEMQIGEYYREYAVYCPNNDCEHSKASDWHGWYVDDAVEDWNAVVADAFHNDRRS